jgi:hypothetical protein
MKKDYLLIVSGVIPLLFSIFVMNFFLKDDRKDLFESAKLLDSSAKNSLVEGELVKFSGIISDKNPKTKDQYVLAVREKFVKGQNGKRSDWFREEFFLQPLLVKIGDGLEPEIQVANDYLPCGDGVKISDLEPKKSRVLGIMAGESVSAVGKILSIEPLKIHTGHSLCTGTIENYKDYLSKKWLGYFFILLCIGVPSIGLIYLGLFKVSKENPNK